MTVEKGAVPDKGWMCVCGGGGGGGRGLKGVKAWALLAGDEHE